MKIFEANSRMQSIFDSNRVVPLLLFFCCLAHFAFSWHMACTRPVWCDEIFTYFQIQGETWSSFWERTTSGLNRMPPLYFALCKLLFGHLEEPIFPCRMLSSFFMCGSIIVLYHFFRFDLPKTWAACLALAVTMPSDFFLSYSYEARPYGAAYAATVLFLWLIRRSEERTCSIAGLVALGFGCLLVPSFHYTFALSSAIIGIAHVVATNHSRKNLFITYFVAGTVYILANLPLLMEQTKFGNALAIIPYASLSVAKDFLAKTMAPGVCLLLSVLSAWGLYIASPTQFEKTAVPLPRIATIMLVALALVPILGFVGSRVIANFFFLPRYYLSTLLIPAFLFLPILALIARFRFSRLSQMIPLFICACTGFVSLTTHAKEFEHIFTKPQKYSYALLPDPRLKKEPLPIITDDLILWLCYQYGGLRNIHYHTSDSELAVRLKAYLPKNLIHQNKITVVWDEFLFIKTIGQPFTGLEANDYLKKPREDYITDPVHNVVEFKRRLSP